MKLQNLKIGTQLIIGFIILFMFVIVIGVISSQQTNQIHLQIETMYNHPLKVRRFIGLLRSDILKIQRDRKDIYLSNDKDEIEFDLVRIEQNKASYSKHLDSLYKLYLGPLEDIDTINQEFIKWNNIHEESLKMFERGEIEEARNRTKAFGIGGVQAEILQTSIQKIDNFATNKGDTLYRTSNQLKESLSRQLILLLLAIFILTLIINFYILKLIRKPLNDLGNAAQKFQDGDLSARSMYKANNEFGIVSDSFNQLVENIQMNMELNKKASILSQAMLSENEVKKFFQATLTKLAEQTNSQMAAAYILSDDKKSYKHFNSIGLDKTARQSFLVDSFDGEFGQTLSSRKIQHIKNISKDTRFVFNSVSGKFIPSDIITIPIHGDKEIIAIVSLASLKKYRKKDNQLIENIHNTLCARIEGILAYRKIETFSKKLESQNSELESQRSELLSQSAELNEQNTELEAQKKHLHEASKLKTNFLSNMSHELRTPLNSVISLSGVLNRRLSDKIPKEENSFIEIIERNGKHLLSLINDILDISRIESGFEEINTTVFDINNLILEISNMLKPQAFEKNIKLIYPENGTELSINSDNTKCHHILQNLIGNAIKFTEKGKVEIKAKRIKDKISITVTDTGIGIDKNDLPNIFDEFRQADGSTSRKFEGTGLGLAIVKKYTNIIGGEITAKSEFGKGSEFNLILPLHIPEQNISYLENSSDLIAKIDNPLKEQDSGSFEKTILLVEDSEPAIIQMKDILEESGNKLLIARDGEQALKIIANKIPDAMILDLMMPRVDGFQVLQTLRENESTSHIPVLILSAKHITKDELKFLKRNNVHQLIQKGDINRNDLINAITNMITPKLVKTVKPKLDKPIIKGKPRLLVVEDNPDNMTTFVALLSDKYKIIKAVNGKEGVEMAKKHLPNLILMDISLPELDGTKAYREIRKDANLQNTPVIAVTAIAMTNEREKIMAIGFDAYITKPINETILFKTIKELLNDSIIEKV